MSAFAKGRIAQLDGLRGLAIGLVLLFHYGATSGWLWPVASQGWIGVDLFFVMSGFLIGGIVIDNRQAANFYSVFYTRRFLRIFPIYYLLLATVALLAWPEHHRLLYNVFHLQNIVVALTHDYGPLWLQVTWSLAVEEHFYLLLPVLVLSVPPRALPYVLIGGIVLAILCRILAYALPVDYPRDFARFFTLCRMDALFYGVLLAVAVRIDGMRERIDRHRRLITAAALALAAGFAAVCHYDGRFADELLLSTVGLTLLGPLFLALVVMAVLYKDSAMSWLTQTRALGWLGRRAYGIYLFHIPALDLTRRAFVQLGFRHFGIALSLAALLVTLAAAALSWAAIEKPLIERGHRSKYRLGRHADALAPTGAAV